jgi:hypothetical protein
VHTGPDAVSQPIQPWNVEPLGVAVKVTAVPLEKLPVQVEAHPRPRGELLMVPEPLPLKFIVSAGPTAAPLLVKQTTFPVMYPVTMAPDEDWLEASLLVVTVAETSVAPQVWPVAVSRPPEPTVII